jgi:hypothetical protein
MIEHCDGRPDVVINRKMLPHIPLDASDNNQQGNIFVKFSSLPSNLGSAGLALPFQRGRLMANNVWNI